MTVPRGYQRADAAGSHPDLPLVGQLLAYAATGAPLGHANRRFGWRPEGNDERQFRWLLKGGMGPLLYGATLHCIDTVPLAWREALLSADLTARVQHGNRIDTMLEMIEACDSLQIRALLLKGISVSEQLYPSEHCRPMADIDVLVPVSDYPRLEAALLDCGFGKMDYPTIEGQHHGAPLFHPRRQTIVELHTLLFPDDSHLSRDTVFAPPSVALHSTSSHYHGRPVKRLTAELQLAYIASSWLNDMTLSGIQPGFIASMFDAVYLLAASGRTLDWSGMPEWLDNDMAKASLYVMATYLPRFGVDAPPSDVLAWLASTQALVGWVQLRLIHGMLDRHLIGGKPWNSAFPPPVPGRYSIAHQFRKRVLNRLSP